MTNGTLDTNGKTVSAGPFNVNAGTKTLTLGASNVTVQSWGNSMVTSGLTFNANSSSISVNNGSCVPSFNGGGLTYSSVTITGWCNAVQNATLSGSNTFANLTITGESGNSNLSVNGNQTITTALTMTGGSAIGRLYIFSSVNGTANTFTANGTVTDTYVDFLDTTGAGSASWSGSSSSIGNCGNNSNIGGTAPVTRHWVATGGTSTGNWSNTNHWSTSNGGAGGASVPLCQDTADFDSGSIDTTGRTITMDMPRVGIIDFTGATHTPALTNSTSNIFFGSITLISGMSVTDGMSSMTINARSSITLASGGNNWGGNMTIDAPGGTITLSDDFGFAAASSDYNLTFTNGTFNANSHNVIMGNFSSNNTNTRTITMGSGTWTVKSNSGNAWNIGSTGLTLNANTSTIKFSERTGTSNAHTFTGGGMTYNNIWFTTPLSGSSTGTWTIAGSNTFNDFKDDNSANAHTITFTHSTTQTISTFHVSGTSTHLITLGSDTSVAFTLTISGDDIVSSDYLSISHSTATPSTLRWYAGTHSTDGGSNSGWIFTAPTVCVAVITGNWNTGSNWNGSCSGAGGVPGSGDDARIDTGVTITQDVATPSTLNSLAIFSGATLDTSGSSYSVSTKTITINAASSPQPSGTFTAHSSTVTLTGVSTSTLFTNNGTFNQGSSIITVTSATGSPQVFASAMTIHALTINAAATVVNAGASITFDNSVGGSALYVQSGVFNIEGRTITPGSGNTLQIDSGGTLCLGGTTLATTATCDSGVTQTVAIAMPSFAAFTFNSASTVIYLSDANTTVSSSPSYGNLEFLPKLTSARTYTLGSSMTVAGFFDSKPQSKVLTVNLGGSLGVTGLLTSEGASSGTTTVDTTLSNYALTVGSLVIATSCTVNIEASAFGVTGTSGTLLTRGTGTFSESAGSVTTIKGDAGVTITDNSTWTFDTLALDPKMTANRTYTWGTGAITINGNFNIIPEVSSGSWAFTTKLNAAVTVAASGTTKIQPGASATGTLDTTSSNYALTTGFLDIESAGTFTSNNSLVTLDGTGTGILFTNNGTLTAVGHSSEWDVTSASGSPTLLNAATTFHILKIATTGALVINAGKSFTIDSSVGSKFWITNGGLSNSVFNLEVQTVTPGTSGTLEIDANQTFCLGGTTSATNATCDSGATQTSASTFPAFPSFSLSVTSNVVYLANRAQTIANVQYGNLLLKPVITGAIGYSVGTNVTVNGNFTIDPNSSGLNLLTVSLTSSLVTVAATGTTLIEQQGLTATSKLDTTGSNFSFSTGSLDIENGGTLEGNGSTISITTTSGTGFKLNSGTFNYDTSTVQYTGDGNVTLTSGAIAFNTLQLVPAISLADIYTFGSGAITVNRDFTIDPSSTGTLNVNLGSGGLTVSPARTALIERSMTATANFNTTIGNYPFSTGHLDIEQNNIVNINGSTMTITGTSGTLLKKSGTSTFTAPNSSTTLINGDGSPILTDNNLWTFGNLSLSPTIAAGNSDIYTFGSAPNLTINGNFAIDPATTGFFPPTSLSVKMGGAITVASANTLSIIPNISTGTITATLDTTHFNYALSTGFLDIEQSGTLNIENSIFTVTGTSHTLLTNNSGAFTTAGLSTTIMNGDGSPTLTDSSSWTFDTLQLMPAMTTNGTDTYMFGGGVITVNQNFQIEPTASSGGQDLEVVMGAKIVVSSSGTTLVQPGGPHSPTATLDTSGGSFTLSTGTLDLENNGTLNARASNIFLNGSTATPFIIYTNGQFITSNSAVTYNGHDPSGNITVSSIPTYDNLTLQDISAGTFVPDGTIAVNSNMDVSAGIFDTTGSNYAISVSGGLEVDDTLNANGSSITDYGYFLNYGTFNAGTSTVELTGGGTGYVGGVNDPVFYNFMIDNSTDKEVDFQNTAPQFSVTGAFTVTGTSGHPMVLRSDSTGTQWELYPTGTSSVTYADVEDGGCEPGYIYLYPTQFTNSGNNDPCWTNPLLTFSISTNSIGFGPLSSSTARYATSDSLGTTTSSTVAHTISIATNAFGGYVLSYIGHTLKSGTHSITAVSDIGTGGTTGSSQFAMCADVSGQGTAATDYAYATPKWTFIDDGASHTIASSTTSTSPSTDTINMRYESNISSTTIAGTYSTGITYVVTGTF